jgi:SAM-dependent methyltransferase
MEKEYAEYLLKRTEEDYNLIAADFARTRAFIPEDIKNLTRYTKELEKVLDSGCASGRLFEVLKPKKIDYFGVDTSKELIKIAKRKYPEAKFQTADCLSLPFSDNFFDKVYSISILHNIPSKEFQLRYLKEARRVLKPKGLLILRVWDFWRRKAALKLIFKYTFFKIIGGSQLSFKDVFVPWKEPDGKILIQRYFHCFTKRELEELVKESGFKIKKSWRAGKDPRTNIYLIAEK